MIIQKLCLFNIMCNWRRPRTRAPFTHAE